MALAAARPSGYQRSLGSTFLVGERVVTQSLPACEKRVPNNWPLQAAEKLTTARPAVVERRFSAASTASLDLRRGRRPRLSNHVLVFSFFGSVLKACRPKPLLSNLSSPGAFKPRGSNVGLCIRCRKRRTNHANPPQSQHDSLLAPRAQPRRGGI